MLLPEQVHTACRRLLEDLLPVPTARGLHAASSSLAESLNCTDVLVGEVTAAGGFRYPDRTGESLLTIHRADWPECWVQSCGDQRPLWYQLHHKLPHDDIPVAGGLWLPFYDSNQIVGAALILGLPREPSRQELDLMHWLGGVVGSILSGARAWRADPSVASSSSVAKGNGTHVTDHEERRHQSSREFHLLRRAADFQAIMDGSETVIYVKNCEGRYEFVNRKFEAIFDLKREDILGRTDEEVFAESPELARRFNENDSMVLRLGRSVQFDEVAPHTDGPHNYVSVKFPLRDEQGEIRGLAGISTDITLRVRAEHAVQMLKDRSTAILNAVADGVVLLDERGCVEYMNPAARALLQFGSEEMDGASFIDLVLPVGRCDDPGESESLLLTRVLQQRGEVLNEEDVFRRPDGSLIPVEYSGVPVQSRSAGAGAVVTFRDITARVERRHARRELRGAQAVQKMLFPQSRPQLSGFDIAGAVFPMQMVCGDYYDFLYRDDDRLVLIVADACGHDLAAALLMVNARAHLRSSLKTHAGIDEVLHDVNDCLARDHQVGKFVTTFLAELDACNRTLTYAGAGQSAVLLPRGGDPIPLKSGSLMLGLQNVLSIAGPVEMKLNSGDLLLICTDGLREVLSPAGDLLSWPTIYSRADELRAQTAQEILDGLVALSRKHAEGSWPQDDVTVIVAKVL